MKLFRYHAKLRHHENARTAKTSNLDNLHSDGGRSVSSAAPGDSMSSSAPGTREDTLLPTVVEVRAEREVTLMKEDFLWVWKWAEELRGRLGWALRGFRGGKWKKMKGSMWHVFSLSPQHRMHCWLWSVMQQTSDFQPIEVSTTKHFCHERLPVSLVELLLETNLILIFKLGPN